MRTASRARGGAFALLLAPFLILFTGVMVVPIGYAVYLSLFSRRSSGLGFGGEQQVFSGVANYTRALADPAFRSSFAVTGLYCLIYIPLMFGAAIVLALLLDSAAARAKRFFQLALFTPHAVPGLIAAIVWVYLYTPGVSPVLNLLDGRHLHLDILGTALVLPSVVNIAVWEWTGYNMVIFYVALQAIPRGMLEAASIDGAGGARTAWSVKLPLIRPSLVLTALFTIIGSLQLFTEPLVLHAGSSQITSSWTPNMYVYSAAFAQGDYGLAAAASVFLAALAGLLSFVVTRFGSLGGGRQREVARA